MSAEPFAGKIALLHALRGLMAYVERTSKALPLAYLYAEGVLREVDPPPPPAKPPESTEAKPADAA